MEQHQDHAEHNQNTYVELVLESHDSNTQQTICNVEHTQSQKKRRRFIPFKYHSKIFKASKKKRYVDDHRISTNSSSYASCRTFKKDSAKSNVSSNTYHEIESIRRVDSARCNTIASKHPVSDESVEMTLATEKEIQKGDVTDWHMKTNAKINYQMEFPKKTGHQVKKYMSIFCMILVCAIISAAIASVLSTKSIRDNIPSDVEHQLSHGEFKKLIHPNVSNEDMWKHINGLRSEVHGFSDESKITYQHYFNSLSAKEDMETLSTKIKIEMLLQTLPNRADLEELSNKTQMNIEFLLQILPNRTDIEDLSNKTKENKDFQQILPNMTVIKEVLEKIEKNIELFQQILPNRTDVDVWAEEIKGISRRTIHADRCKTDCRNQTNGNYQSCFTCKGFVTCANNVTVKQLCADSSLLWDDFEKECLYKSRTCDPLHVFKRENK